MARVGSRATALHLWRMGILFLIGLFHQTYLWSGDILATYAVLGVLLLLFRARSTRVLERAPLARAGDADARARRRHRLGVLARSRAPRRALAATVVELGYPARQALFAFAMFLLGLAAGRARGRGRRPRAGAAPPSRAAVGGGNRGQPRVRRARRSLGRVDRVVDRGAGRGADRGRGAGARARLRRAAAARARAPALAARARPARRGRTPLAHELSDAVADRRGRCSPASERSTRRPASRSRAPSTRYRSRRAAGGSRTSASAPSSGSGAPSATEGFRRCAFEAASSELTRFHHPRCFSGLCPARCLHRMRGLASGCPASALRGAPRVADGRAGRRRRDLPRLRPGGLRSAGSTRSADATRAEDREVELLVLQDVRHRNAEVLGVPPRAVPIHLNEESKILKRRAVESPATGRRRRG